MAASFDHYSEAVEGENVLSFLVSVKNLAALPGARLRAIRLLVKFAATYRDIQSAAKKLKSEDLDVSSLGQYLKNLDYSLCDLLHDHFIVQLSSGAPWDVTKLQSEIECAREAAADNRVRNFEVCDDLVFLKATSWYMLLLARHQLAGKLANTFAWPKLPPELIEIIRDYINPEGEFAMHSASEWRSCSRLSVLPYFFSCTAHQTELLPHLLHCHALTMTQRRARKSTLRTQRQTT